MFMANLSTHRSVYYARAHGGALVPIACSGYLLAMRVVVVGATGNVGTSVLSALAAEPDVDQVIGVARRLPARSFPKASFRSADVVSDDLTDVFRGADAVVHLAWLIQPGRDRELLHQVNVRGTERVMEAVARAGVPALIYASSVGAYSPGPKDRQVDESWPTGGIASSFYSRHKAAVEQLLDRLEADQPALRVVRLRPGLIFKAEAADEIRRYFVGHAAPRIIFRRRLLPVVPDLPELRFQAVHSVDVGDAFRRAVLSDSRGAFNVAAEPVIAPRELAELLRAWRVPMPAGILRLGADLTYRLHLQPVEPGWLDMALQVPLMDTARIRQELGWTESRDGVSALRELLDGMGAGTDLPTPPLAARYSQE
jgi:nucleoside-diphosphate-sugar epimerase